MSDEFAHPLDPLNEAEVAGAGALLRACGTFGAAPRFISIELREPPRETVRAWREGDPIARVASAVVLDPAAQKTYEAVVSLDERRVLEARHVPGVQPMLVEEEFKLCDELLRADPRFIEALRKRGITDLSLVQIEGWTAGNYGAPEENERRILRPLIFVHAKEGDNGYARPVEGLLPVVDVNAAEVVRVDDCGVVPLPPEPGDYTPDAVPSRGGIKPLDIVQRDGVSFTLRGREVRWQKWRFRVGFSAREGLVLHTVSYDDDGTERTILQRAALVEMTVPYGDPSPAQYRKNAFDVGEYGMGRLANSLELGCDCLGEITYFPAVLCTGAGDPYVKQNAVCLHEEDFSILWKHSGEVRRRRRLVVSFISTVGNYDYAYYWYLYQDGTIEFEVKLTGILSVGALPPGTTSRFGTLLAPGLYAPHHQHFMCVRLDLAVDGTRNNVFEVHSESLPPGADNPHGNAFVAVSTHLRREQEAQQSIDPLNGRYWLIASADRRNRLGEPTAYKLIAGDNVRAFQHPDSSVARRAGYMRHHVWVTPYEPSERFPAGEYPNQHPGGDGLPRWTEANRSLENGELVLWYVLGSNHIARPEEWPVMPVCSIGFMLRPAGFFARNPSLDVPPSAAGLCHS